MDSVPRVCVWELGMTKREGRPPNKVAGLLGPQENQLLHELEKQCSCRAKALMQESICSRQSERGNKADELDEAQKARAPGSCTIIFLPFLIPFVSFHNASGLPWGLIGKDSACQCRIHGFNRWVGKIHPLEEEIAAHSSVLA